MKKKKIPYYLILSLNSLTLCPICWEITELGDLWDCPDCERMICESCMVLSVDRNTSTCRDCEESKRVKNNEEI